MERESLLNVLMYVFENYYEQDETVEAGSPEITDDMLRAGFERRDIEKALSWFRELHDIREVVASDYGVLGEKSIRVFTTYEIEKMSRSARAYLYFLEQTGILDPVSRELLLDRVMALEEPLIEVPELKWVALMILFSQPDKQQQLKLMEDLILFHDENESCH